MKQEKTNSKQQPVCNGFTLIEVLLYVAISSFLLLAVSSFMVASLQARAEGQVIAEVEQQGQQIMQVITSAVRTASSITTPGTGISGSTLTLVKSTGSTNPTIFTLNAGDVTITEAGSAAVSLDNNQVTASALTITNVSRANTPGAVRIQFTLSYNANVANRAYNYSKVFYATAAVR